ncbi:MAG: hypothetical protein KAI67_03005 [Candidatus Pacebacteria bacterium]|nr:hypothetical protein [Candidatus Paceibacterota bacterium]
MNKDATEHSSIEIHGNIEIEVLAEQYSKDTKKYKMFTEYLNNNTNNN